MGNALPALLKTNCFHDLYYYYVLNESECHSNCADFCSCDCETHQVEPEGDSGSEIEVEVENCCSIRNN